MFIRAGKCLPVTCTEVFVQLKNPPRFVFGEQEQDDASHRRANRIRFQLNPNVVIALSAQAKMPGEGMLGEEVELVARHQSADEMEPYERLLGDAMHGDQRLFAREDAIEAAWRVVDPVLGNAAPLYPYDPNTWGPAEAKHISPSDGWANPVP
jgi:glucose-6-phosphate 1-dehydrogenase